MTAIDLDAMNRTRPLINALPGEPAPYYLASGEGQRYEVDGQLWTVIARPADTGGLSTPPSFWARAGRVLPSTVWPNTSAPTTCSKAVCNSGFPVGVAF